jgi:hypothetical protein
MLAGLGAVRVSLEDAARKLAAAAELLAGLNSNTAAQEAERLALTRLEALLDAFAETVEEAAPTNGGNVGGNNAGGARPQRRPALELLEIKLLRLLQVELNQRTERHERRQAAGDDELAEIEREAWDLAVEQARLAELVKQMLLRNNSRQRSDE